MSRVYYNQSDNRWAKYPYPSSSHPKATIKTSGCGPTSAAMIVASLKDNDTVNPKNMAQAFLNNNLRGAEGTKNSAFKWTANEYELDMFETVNVDDAIDTLKKGGMAVAICAGGGVFSTGGHYVVMAYMRNTNTICIFDPYLYNGKFNIPSRKNKVTVNGNDVDITIKNFKKYSKVRRMFCYNIHKEEYKPKVESKNIKKVQKWLNETYNSKLTINGKANEITKTAIIKAWKKQCNEVWGADFATDKNGNIIGGKFGNKAYNFSKKVIRQKGDNGKMVKFVQALCYFYGYNQNAFNGNYGNGTIEDVKNFKIKNNLSEDGQIVGQGFWTKTMQ